MTGYASKRAATLARIPTEELQRQLASLLESPSRSTTDEVWISLIEQEIFKRKDNE
jgi:hypothetical protein